MSSQEHRLRLDLLAARYLDALEQGDFDTTTEIWQLALAEPELEAALREVHAGLIEELARDATAATATALAVAVEAHLPSAEVLHPGAGVVTVGDVADELFRHTPDRLPGEAYLFNERLRKSKESLPPHLGLSKLMAWAEAKYGAAPAAYWKAFRQAAVKLELRRAAQAEYQMAARPSPKPEERT